MWYQLQLFNITPKNLVLVWMIGVRNLILFSVIWVIFIIIALMAIEMTGLDFGNHTVNRQPFAKYRSLIDKQPPMIDWTCYHRWLFYRVFLWWGWCVQRAFHISKANILSQFFISNIIKKPRSGFADKVVHEVLQHLLPNITFGRGSLYQFVDQHLS